MTALTDIRVTGHTLHVTWRNGSTPGTTTRLDLDALVPA
ncbi:hypothetical protein BN2537_7057 [Streptomyces venezuelae]|nr:hypothetical protein BN2537_7057 [Streptomyces venezuelae]